MTDIIYTNKEALMAKYFNLLEEGIEEEIAKPHKEAAKAKAPVGPEEKAGSRMADTIDYEMFRRGNEVGYEMSVGTVYGGVQELGYQYRNVVRRDPLTGGISTPVSNINGKITPAKIYVKFEQYTKDGTGAHFLEGYLKENYLKDAKEANQYIQERLG